MAVRIGIIFNLLALSGLLFGQQGANTIQSPTLGFVFDAASHTLRPISGIPGASLVGSPLDIGMEVEKVSMSPRQDYFLATRSDNQEIALLQPGTAGLSAKSIPGALSAPDLITLSPTGSVAALYRGSGGLLQVLAGLPDSPRILREIPSANQDATLTSIAVADDGQAVLLASATNVSLIAGDGIPRPLSIAGPISAMAFQPYTHNAIAASGQNSQVWLILDGADIPEIQPLVGPDGGIVAPVAAAFSLDGKRAFIANCSGNLVTIDLSGAAPQSFSCQCNITGLHHLSGSSVFRLTDPSAGPLIVFDGDAPQPRMLFIPTAPAGDANETR